MKLSLTALVLSMLLPAFSQNTVGTITHSVEAQDGYTLFEFMGDSTVYLIDNCGRVVHHWETEFLPGASVYLQEDGSIIRAGKTPTTHFNVGGQGGVLERFNWFGIREWRYYYSDSTVSLHHDFEVLPNGNILAIAFEYISESDAIAQGRDSSLIVDGELWPEKIVEFAPIGSDSAEIVWEWRMWDHLIQDFDASKSNFGVVEAHPELFDINFVRNGGADWAHANSVAYNETLDQIVISLNFFNEFVIIDHSTSTAEAASHSGGNSGKGGDILYRYGNPESYRHGDSDDRVNYRQHDVHWIADGLNDGGKILFYNNGNGRPGDDYSTVDIVSPVVDGTGAYVLEADTTFAPDTPEWSYVAPNPTDFFSPIISGAQRLPNGNTLICQGRDGRLFEINSQTQEIVWEYQNPITNTGILTQGDTVSGSLNVFRALRYLPSFAGFVGRDLTPGNPIELDPDLDACLVVSTEGLTQEKVFLYPNPVRDVLHLNTLVDDAVLLDARGRIVDTYHGVKMIQVSDLESGMYFLKVNQQTLKLIKR